MRTVSAPEVPRELLLKYGRPAPRYTSYPPIPAWDRSIGPAEYRAALESAAREQAEPLSLYIHLPFCRRRCLYCGCNVVYHPPTQRARNLSRSTVAGVGPGHPQSGTGSRGRAAASGRRNTQLSGRRRAGAPLAHHRGALHADRGCRYVDRGRSPILDSGATPHPPGVGVPTGELRSRRISIPGCSRRLDGSTPGASSPHHRGGPRGRLPGDQHRSDVWAPGADARPLPPHDRNHRRARARPGGLLRLRACARAEASPAGAGALSAPGLSGAVARSTGPPSRG